MALIKRKIGNLIQEFTKRNLNRDDIPFTGINIDKEFMPSHADTNEIDSAKYKIVSKNDFVFSGMQTGRDNCIRIGMYDKDDLIQVSPAYQTFKVTSKDILPRFFFMYFKSKEKDRYGAFLSDGSIRSNLDWDRFCDIELNLPSIDIQRKYVVIYEGLLANLHAYESKLEDLKLVCDGYIEDLRKKYPSNLHDKLFSCDERNLACEARFEMGVSIEKVFIPTKANSSDIQTQKVVHPNQFAFNSNTSRNSDTISIAYNDSDDLYAVSNTYVVFSCDKSINSKYLKLWFDRDEFNRFCRFNSWGSARETISLQDIESYEIGLPPIEIQKSIVEVFNIYNERKEYINRLKTIINNICPLLVRVALEEAKHE